MARFEFSGVPDLSPTGAPSGDYENITASPAAFGAQKARALQTLGQGVENVGEAGFNVLKFHNKIASDYEQTNTFQDVDKMLYGDPSKSTPGADGKPVPDLGFMGLTGRDAADRREDTIKAIEERRQQGRNNLSSPEAQLEYDNSTKRYVQNAYNQIGRHSETQYKSWAADSNETGANQARNDFVRNLDNPQGNEAAARYIQFREQQAQVKYGNDPQIMAGVKENARRDLLKAHVDAVAVHDAPGAMKILEKPANKDLAGDQFDNMYRGLEARANKQLGDRAGASALDKARTGTPSNFETPQGIPRVAPRLVSQAETGDPNLGPRALGNISRDAGGTKSYGFTGLNSGSGSLAQFVREYGAQFGLRGSLGSPGFDAQWHAASTEQTKEFRDAQLKFFADHDVATVRRDLRSVGIPENITGDPRVMTYFADRHVQMGNLALSQAGYAWDRANGDVPTFLRNMTAIDGRPENLQSNFRTAIATGVYGPAGHATRLRTRLNGALAAGSEEGEGGTDEVTPAAFVPGQTGQSPAAAAPAGESPPTQRVSVSQPTVAASIRPNAYQNLRDNPELRNNPEAFARAETVVHQQLQAEHLAEEQTTQTKKAANDDAAGDFTTELLNAQTSSKPDYIGMSNRIANDPRLDFKTKHELSQWVSDAAGGHAERTYGPGFWDIYKQIHAPAGDPGKITDPSQIYDKVRPGGPLTIAGADKAIAEIRGAKTPEGEAEAQMKKQFFEHVARPQITFTDEQLKIKDQKGDENFLKFLAAATTVYDKGKASGLTAAQLLDPESKDYVGRIIENFKAPAAERFADHLEDKGPGLFSRIGNAILAPFHVETPAAPAPFDPQSVKALPDLKAAYDKRQITAAQAREMAIARGWARAPQSAAPQVPTGP